jgi:putative Ca2+/H+ antiporter (TMEM165/GDT1 family)
MTAAHLFWVAYSMILVAELVGDKLLYGIAALTARFHTAPVIGGMTLAFGCKMFVAVAIGHVLQNISGRVLTAMTVVAFATTAVTIWRHEPLGTPRRGAAAANPQPPGRSNRHAALVTFGSLFFSEWGDYGQLTAAALVATSGSSTVVWLSGTSALLTKGLIAVLCGVSVRRWVPAQAVRYAAVGLYAVAAVMAALRVH